MRLVASWVMFGAAVASFSKLWVGVRSALEGDRLYSPPEALLWIALFLGSMGYLAFVIYAADRDAGRTKRAIVLFDRVLDRRARDAQRLEAGREP